MPSEPVTPALADLAAAMGVATSYEDYLRRPVAVGAEPVRLALGAMGIAAQDDRAAAAALARIQAERAARPLPPAVVVRSEERWSTRLTDASASALITLETGESINVPLAKGVLQTAPDLPLGYHRLRVDTATGTSEAHLIVVPQRCPMPLERRSFGWMAQLYAVRSKNSWGIGDYRDLADLATWSGHQGAAMVLVNPLHAASPVLPQQNSPYSPTSRRYRSPLYLRVEEVPELSGLAPAEREQVLALGAQLREAADPARIDRDAVFAAKTDALELLASVPRSGAREQAFRAWMEREGVDLVDFATFCALAERHGLPWQAWPSALHHPSSGAVAAAREELGDRVSFHMWLQWLCDEQLRAAQDAATAAGMSVGVVHDLAVGVDPGGADAWSLQDEIAGGMTVGAPPDGFNQRGQDWGLPPLLPNRLPETGFAAFRDMLRSVLRHAGGIRIDHIMGLWRLWWVPEGLDPSQGTYVQYPAEDLLGVLALEADRGGAMVIGEDLGTVQIGVRESLAGHRVLSSRVLYFEHVDDDPEQPRLPAAEYPELALASISTHDLPTAAGWWADEEIKAQSALGLFGDTTTPAAEASRKARERQTMVALLRREGLIGDDPSPDELLVAMHEFLARTPSILVATGLGDAIGDLRQPNLPGTTDAYPNWRLPLARPVAGEHQPVWLEDLPSDERLAAVLGSLKPRPA